jgi:hypothetical protein
MISAREVANLTRIVYSLCPALVTGADAIKVILNITLLSPNTSSLSSNTFPSNDLLTDEQTVSITKTTHTNESIASRNHSHVLFSAQPFYFREN